VAEKLSRKQFHFRPSERGLCAWDIDRLIELTQDLPVEQVCLTAIREVETNYWFAHHSEPTVRVIVEHMRMANEADLSYPIIIDGDGRIMDGMHRVVKALLEGRPTVAARRLSSIPDPDYVGVHPDDLPTE